MELLWLTASSRAVALVATILFFVNFSSAQQFSDVLLGNDVYPGLSDQCADALNTTVQSCPGFLATVAVDMPRLDASSLHALCTSSCRSSLTSVRGVIASGCGSSTDVIEINSVVYPATFVIDRLVYTYDISCAKDSDTGTFCDTIYLDGLANGTAADSCSDCSLGVVRTQLNSPFGYHEQFAQGFESITSKCGATGYAFISPAQYAISTKPYSIPTDAPTCGSPYEVQSGDSCDSIATSRGVSTYAVIKAANTDPDCINLRVGAKLCLPEPCTLYRVQYDDTCESILASISGVRANDLLTWNPNLNLLCTNIDTMYTKLICVSPPGRTLEDVTGVITTPPTATQPPPTAVPRPANAKAESHAQCAGWYEIQDGDYCQAISIREGILLRDFFFLNPSVDDPDCLNLWLETSYCVRAVGDINTYSGYPYSTSPIYTLTSSAYITTEISLVQTIAPSATPIVELPLAPGSQTAADGCLEFIDHTEVIPQLDQSQQPDVPTFTNQINSCDFVSATFGVDLAEFLSWNPSLEGLDPCYLQSGYRYCAEHSNATDEPARTRTCIDIEEPYPDTILSCSCFTRIRGHDAGLYTCEDLAHDQNITVSDLVSWNSWIGAHSACDIGLYADMAETGERPVCVGVGGSGPITSGSTVTPTATSQPTSISTVVSPGGPTQTGIVVGCRKYYVAVSGDGCWAIANSNGIDLDDFYAWNPAVGSDCANIWPDYAYCVQGPAPAPTTTPTATSTSGGVSPPGPTQPGTISTCQKWHTVVDGDGCWAIQQTYNIPDFATLLSWNPGLGSNCESLWLDYSICVGV
ncbi:hypothetical protein DL770_005977 [Monosporascus sp. CRB-9-2]|nr:hypothetical protein DL770_005977 [Monosporascus sp. CRB-9-2]